jgi:YVTN family beta-propeller protein
MLILLILVSLAGAEQLVDVPNSGSNTVSVIDTTTNNITATVNIWFPHNPNEIAVN